ncbi:hypothetical protein [Mycobacterium uberis]|uniref:hypothetical protein n=1 Tax=Mycobacterium uberis TaxID=2162698 RepID=UPI003C78297B
MSVVPGEIGAWTPDSALHAMVTNKNGNSVPAEHLPLAVSGKPRDCGCLHGRMGGSDADREQRNGSDWHECH